MTEYVRIKNIIYQVDALGRRQLFHKAESISQARKWVKSFRWQNPKAVIRVEEPPQKSAPQLRQEEIQALRMAQADDRMRQRNRDILGPPTGPRPYVMPDKNSSSFLRERNARRNKSRNSRNGRAGTGST